SRNNLNSETIDIHNNELNIVAAPYVPQPISAAVGINLERPDGGGFGSGLVDISNNIIVIDGKGTLREGIHIDGTNSSSTDICNVSQNIITIRNNYDAYHRGISLVGGFSDAYAIHDNEIHFDNASIFGNQGSWGIYCNMLDGFDHSIDHNSIIGTGTNLPYFCSIHLDNAKNIYYCEDTMTYGSNGFHFLNNCSGQDIRNSQIGDNFNIGLHHASFFPIGNQFCRSNSWSTNPSAYASRAASSLNPVGSYFEVVIAAQYYPALTNPSWISPISFFVANPSCQVTPCVETAAFEEEATGNSTNVYSGELSQNNLWHINFVNNFKGFVQNDGFVPETTDNSAYFAEHYYHIRKAKSFSSGECVQMNFLQGSIHQKLKNASLIWNDTSLTVAQRYSLLFDSISELNLLSNNLNDIISNVNENRVERLMNVLSENQGLLTVSPIEANIKLYCKYLIQVSAGSSFAFEESMLRELGMVGDIDVDGFPVWWARRLLKIEENATFDLISDESQEEFENRGSRSLVSNFESLVFPNPNGGIFHLSNTSDTGLIKIVDILGNVVLMQPGWQGSTEIDLTNKPDGIYFVYIEDSSNSNIFQTLCILKIME
ncbi:MAG: T9SS type A sorting domain-containing protein, partial [Saprospiraceae bacterium]